MKRARLSAGPEGRERPGLIAARERAHLSLEEVGKRLRVSRTTVHRWEKKGQIPQPLHIRNLCELYGMSPQALGFTESAAMEISQEQIIVSEKHEEQTSLLAAFRCEYLPLRLLHIVWHWPVHSARYHELQKLILLELEDNRMHDELSRRDVLRLLAALPLDYCYLSAEKAVFKKPVPEILAHCAAGIPACWQLRGGKDLLFADEQISAYLPTLKAIVKSSPEAQRQVAADLLAQSLLLKSILAWAVATIQDAINYVQQAELYSDMAKNRLLQIVVLREKAAALFYARQWKQALIATRQAKYLLDERDKQDKQRQQSAFLHPAEEPIPQLVYSHVYAGLGKYQAYDRQKEDALRSLQKAHTAFFAQSNNEAVPVWIDHHIGNLLKYEAQTYAYLDLHKKAVDTLEQVHTQYAQNTTIHLTCRLSALTEQIMAEISRNDQSRRMDWCIDRWQKALDGANLLQSNVQFDNVMQAYTAMCAAWPGEKRIKELRELIVH